MIAFLCIAMDAGAHTRSESYSHWHQSDTTITGTITIPLREVMLLYQTGDSVSPPGELFRDELIAQHLDRHQAGRKIGYGADRV